MSEQRFAGVSMVMVGGAGGVGRACLTRALAEGARVAVLDRQAEPLEDVQGADNPGRLLQVECDVTDPASVRRGMEAVLSWAPKVEALIYLVGGIAGQPLLEAQLDDWERVHAINNTGFLLCAQQVVPRFVENGKGNIVTVSSVAANIAGIGRCIAYKSSKAALVQLTRTLAVDFAAQGIRANCILPGPIATGFGRGGRVAGRDELSTPSGVVPPLARRATPEEIANAALFLVSDDSSYITGAELPVDGGVLAI